MHGEAMNDCLVIFGMCVMLAAVADEQTKDHLGPVENEQKQENKLTDIFERRAHEQRTLSDQMNAPSAIRMYLDKLKQKK